MTAQHPVTAAKKYGIWLRTVTIVNTDPQRRCYNGCNFSERTDYGEWRLFQTWEGLEFSEAVARGLRRASQRVKVLPEGEKP